MIYRFTIFVLCICFSTVAIGQTSLEGKVTDEQTGEAILFGTVALYKNGVLLTGTETDLDGNYIFSDVDPGSYDIEITYVGYQPQRVTNITAKAGQINKVDVVISEGTGVTLDDIVIIAYKEPLVDFDNTTQGGTVTADEIRTMPTKNITAIAATTAGISTVDGGDISIRGSREDGTYYYIDGVRVRGENINNVIPQSEIDQLQVITGGIESKYGDVTGGIISITTKGPSEKFTGGVEVETSEFLDAFGYNLVTGNVSGPLLKNKAGKSILGFRVFGQFTNIADDDPSAVGVYRASEDLINELTTNPVSTLNGSPVPSAENITEGYSVNGEPGVNLLKRRPNETTQNYNISAKIDARLNDAIDMTFSGTYYDGFNQFNPATAASTNEASNSRWSLYNWTNNPFYYREGYRGNVRFRHKIGKQGFANDDEEENPSIFRNFSYTLQGGYEKAFESTEDDRHGDNFFRYGYYGVQERRWEPVASIVSDSVEWDGPVVDFGGGGQGVYFAHQGYREILGEATPDLNINPAQAGINASSGLDVLINGLQPGPLNNVWELYYNVGRPYNRYFKNEEDRYTANVSAGFDLLPGGSESGKHNIQFGFTYEQRFLREWTIVPEDIWNLARLNANQHIIGVDNTTIIDSFFDNDFGASFPQFQTNIQPEDFEDNLFFRSVRELTGASLNEYVNVDEINPDQLSLDMFSAGELNNQNIMTYFGYDYLGNKLDNNVTFNDFFSGRDENGRRTFNVAPLQPIYVAGYIQDKFKYKDIIVRLGLRLDYYDANTKVLKDPYSLYPIMDASEFFASTNQAQPRSVDDDYKVYVTGPDSEDVLGFRDGDRWFSANGTSLSGGNLLFGGGVVYPFYQEQDASKRQITDPNFDPNTSFEDYTPQLNFMPRVAFSFPISNDAGFFAHYDVLVQRPPSNTGGTALDYFYMENPQRFGTATAPASNPDLKPEKTIDYEIGFQSKLSNSSAIKISAYYKEMRDMIQRRFYTFLPPPLGTYQTFSNVDFGTVKGFSFTYDLRRTGNIQLSTSYTLQFADGSGSNADSSDGINERGIIRELFPLNFDERHRITAVIDYRFTSGKSYNGPRIGGLDMFANAGVNFLLTGVSGRPYSQFQVVPNPLDQRGLLTINEARLPWILNADMRVDKNFAIKVSETSKSALNFNIYLRFENLFNTRNIVDVFNVTGDAEDDGYLVASNGLDQQAQILDVGKNLDSFYSHYDWRVTRPNHYTRPRRIYLGLIFDF